MASRAEQERAYAALESVGFPIDDVIEGMRYASQIMAAQLPPHTKMVTMALIAHYHGKVMHQAALPEILQALQMLVRATEGGEG
jgi:hypothetical protein